jgi:hypothetical protein
MARREGVPFRCEECGGEFAATQGGLCRPCARVLFAAANERRFDSEEIRLRLRFRFVDSTVHKTIGGATMRSRLWCLLFVLLAVGCDRSPAPTALRCGEAPSGFNWVVAGTDNRFFTAMSRQSIKIKPGVEVKVVSDATGRPTGLTMARDNDGIGANCSCPGGCKTPGPVGCVIVYEPGGPNATCSGDCQTENACCAGCGWAGPAS